MAHSLWCGRGSRRRGVCAAVADVGVPCCASGSLRRAASTCNERSAALRLPREPAWGSKLSEACLLHASSKTHGVWDECDATPVPYRAGRARRAILRLDIQTRDNSAGKRRTS